MDKNVTIAVDNLITQFDDLQYVTDLSLATSLYLLKQLRKPLLIEGEAGVGKTETAKILASHLQTDLIRLQCYEGLDIDSAVYEWNYQRQLLAIKMQENRDSTIEEKEKMIFSEKYLLERPLLKSIKYTDKPPVLLIDEIDRADIEFEALLLELLSDFQISIPELGTIKAQQIPYVILTSNRTRELSDALKRRCLYHWIDYPDYDKELKIILKKFPNIKIELAKQVVKIIQHLRTTKLKKIPGIAETLDWVDSLLELKVNTLDGTTIEQTLGSILKSVEDIKSVKSGEISISTE
ncbi:MAG: MoxR family ATPase [Candidatus Heimdallarchaeota archaeon]|nr:MoxR family ATPase [Candidatus Heimdallarchaeota archaeon]